MPWRAGLVGGGRVTLQRLALLAIALAGCSSTKPCNPGTVLLTVMFDATTSAADRIDVNVSEDGGAATLTTLSRQPGPSDGSIEIYFPTGGYPKGKSLDVT